MTVQQNTARGVKHGPSADELWDVADALHRQYGKALHTLACERCGETSQHETPESERIWKQYEAALFLWAAAAQEEAP